MGVRKTSIRTAVTAGACLSLPLFPTACTPAEDSADTHRDDGSEATTDAEATDRWSAFADILDDPSALDLASDPSPDATGDYSYALGDVTGEDEPELLIAVDDKKSSPVHIVTTDDSGNTTVSRGSLRLSGADADGGRAAIHFAESGNGMYQATGQANSPAVTTQRYELDGDKLVNAGDVQTSPSGDLLPGHVEATFTSTTDRGPFDKVKDGGEERTGTGNGNATGSAGQGAQGGAAAPAPGTAKDAPQAEADAGADVGPNEVEIVGTVEELSTAEAAEGKTPPNNEDPNNRYFVLRFDKPQSLPVRSSSGGASDQTHQAALLDSIEHTPYGSSTGQSSRWENYAGQHVRVVVAKDNLWQPSDAGLPLGMLRMTSGEPAVSLAN